MKRIKQALIIVGIGVIAYIYFSTYSRLADRYCWECTAQDYFDKGARLILKDDDESKGRGLRFLETAAEQWHVDAQILLAELYFGDFPETYHIRNEDKIAALRSNVPVDKQKGVSYFDKLAVGLYSAKDNYIEMLYNFGVLFKMGILTSPDNKEEAKKWFSMAAERGNVHAMYELGTYYNAKGDYESARQWFTRAFNRGKESRSAIMIGDFYFYGKGLARDYNQSIEWYNKALDALGRSDTMYPKKVRYEVTQNARHRLKIAEGKVTGVVTLNYGLGGGVRTYSIYVPEVAGSLIGIVRNEDGNIEARLQEGILSDTDAPGRTVDSMNEGLYWVLNTYASHTYGADKKFNFVLAKKRDHVR